MNTPLVAANTLKLLQAYLSSHAVFNALTYVQHHIVDDEKRAALKALSAFANFIRKTTDQVDEVARMQEKEIDMLSHYLMLEQWRFADSIAFNMQASCHAQAVPCFMYAPFVEQIILIGLANTKEKSHLTIINHGKMGLEVKCNFNLPLDYHLSFNEEQANRRNLLLERIQLFKKDYKIEMTFINQNAYLKIEPIKD